MANLRDFTGKNKIFTGTKGMIVSDVAGVTGDRVDEKGRFRYNSTLELMEYYNGTSWIVIDAPPTISSVSPTSFDETDTSVTFTILGSNFSSSGLSVQMFNASGTEITIGSVTRVSSTEVTFVLTVSNLGAIDEPYDIKVTNGSGLAVTNAEVITVNQSPTWTTSAGSLGTLGNSNRAASELTTSTLVATDPEGGDVDYYISSGTLPTGLSLDSETGVISGTANAESSDTTYNFTVEAHDTASNFTSRAFSITVQAPVITTFNSPGTFTVPAALTSVDVLVVAGGGGGGAEPGNNGPGGGGAGGLIYRPGYPISPGTPISVTVGSGGQGGTASIPGDAGSPGQGITGGSPDAQGANGVDSVFSGLTAKGGGGGGCPEGLGPSNGKPGGSGGGSVSMGTTPNSAGSATQPSQPDDSATYGFGNPGGGEPTGIAGQIGGGGGGAGAAGGNCGGPVYPTDAPNLPTAIAQGFGKGGIGREYSISGSPVYYAGGGSGMVANSNGINPGTFIPGAQGGGGNGGWQIADNTGQQSTRPGTANRGGGGGGGRPGHGGDGGSGVVIVQA